MRKNFSVPISHSLHDFTACSHPKIDEAIHPSSCTLLLGVLKQLKGHVKSTAIGVSLIKGLHVGFEGPELLSHMIKSELSLYNDVAVVMGANVASEVALVCHCYSGSNNDKKFEF
jgi:glycerol-3-phosphate dehydrogenase